MGVGSPEKVQAFQVVQQKMLCLLLTRVCRTESTDCVSTTVDTAGCVFTLSRAEQVWKDSVPGLEPKQNKISESTFGRRKPTSSGLNC